MAEASLTASVNGSFSAELLVWLSPGFPAGSFAFSHGLERLSEKGAVRDRTSFEDWVSDLTRHGSLRNDLILLACAWNATARSDQKRLDEVAEIAAALQPTAERSLEALTQGGAYAAAIDAAWACSSIRYLIEHHSGRIAYPVAVGASAGDRRCDLNATLAAYAIAFVTNLISAAIRLGIMGQFDGQRAMATLLDELGRASTAASHATLDDLGGALLLSDIASMEHETQYTRLFRS